MSSFSETLVAGRTKNFTGTLVDANGDEIAITAGSNVRFKMFRRAGTTPVLDLDGNATANGSVVTFTALSGNYAVRIDQADSADITPGPYSVEVSLVDHGDSDKIKHAQFGVITVLGAPAGGIN